MHAYVPLSALESPAPVLARLLAADGDGFVREAYRALLGREPDPVGWRDGLARLDAGAPRMALLADLARSPEAMQAGPAHRALGA
ncbi:MAG TPA: DUF4214 domain-containing protein, partial [Usitatibacter sp.]|nr:DUF4214 domain-containing protein [Usitatibacter sp.]